MNGDTYSGPVNLLGGPLDGLDVHCHHWVLGRCEIPKPGTVFDYCLYDLQKDRRALWMGEEITRGPQSKEG